MQNRPNSASSMCSVVVRPSRLSNDTRASRSASAMSSGSRSLGLARHEHDPLLMAEALRPARVSFDSLLGRATTEDMLDALFGRFCIGK